MKAEEFKDSKPDGTVSSSAVYPGVSKSKFQQNHVTDAQLREASLHLQKTQYESMIQQALLDKEASIGKIGVAPEAKVKPSYPKIDPPSTAQLMKRKPLFGKVRGTPYGACLQKDIASLDTDADTDVNIKSSDISAEAKEEADARNTQWAEWREKNFDPIYFPVEGFDHMYGKKEIDQQEDYGAEAAALAAQMGPEVMLMAEEVGADADVGREYGSFRTPLDAPIGSLKDKWRVLPHFLQVRSLMRQHIDSFDYFVNTEMKEIVQSPSACEIRSEHDPKFYLRYTDCWVGEPSVEEDSYATTQATPFQCRLRDCTYSAPIYVNIRYTRGRQIVVKKKVRAYVALHFIERSIDLAINVYILTAH
jgi:hypothetical protein